jgi:hypothetical protein
MNVLIFNFIIAAIFTSWPRRPEKDVYVGFLNKAEKSIVRSLQVCY